MDLGLSGLASGFDWKTLIDQLIEVERAPERQLQSEQSLLQQRNNAYGSIKTQLGTLQNRAHTLKDPSLYDSRSVSVSDATVASATAAAGAAAGRYTVNVTQMATAASWLGAAGVGKPLSNTDDVSALALGSAGFATPITAGTITVNGKPVTIDTADTLQQVFDKISTATDGAVTGAYSAASDKIALSSSSPIVLGSLTDTSNFLQVARLNFNNSGTVVSAAALGSVRLGSTLASANTTTAISDGGSGAGEFKINGVSVKYNSSTDTVSQVLARINYSQAGVTASYDAINDRFTLTNKATGDNGVALADVTGNFLAATQLQGGSLQRGQNLAYTINGGGAMTSQSNTITESSSGLTGISITALKEGATTVQVGTDTAKIKTAIADFVTEFNRTQSLIDTQTASSTDAKGKVTAGILASELDASEIASRLRGLANGAVSGLGGVLKRLEGLGYVSNGTDNTLALQDSAALDNALANNLTSVKEFFTQDTIGFAAQMDAYLEATIGDGGSLVNRQNILTTQSKDIDTQISDMERLITDEKARMTASFVAMETAQQRSNQQLQFLQKQFGL